MLNVRAESAEVDAKAKIYNAEIQGYVAETRSVGDIGRASAAIDANKISLAAQTTAAGIANAKAAADVSSASADVAVERANAIGTLYTGLASASLSAANVSYGFRNSTSMSSTCTIDGADI